MGRVQGPAADPGVQKRDKGRHQNTSVETGDFLQKNIKCMLVEFCRSVTPSPHVRVKGQLLDDASCCYTILGNVFL